ncbi:RE1 [Symbiodinium sp. CCMP2592]|nr:RE1 [Symbiodinium sp. CCMP2592]
MSTADATSFVWGREPAARDDSAQEDGAGDVSQHPDAGAVPVPPFRNGRDTATDPWDQADPWQSGAGRDAWWGHSWGNRDGWSGYAWGNGNHDYASRRSSNAWGRHWSQGDTWTTGSTGTDSVSDRRLQEDQGLPDDHELPRHDHREPNGGGSGPWAAGDLPNGVKTTSAATAPPAERGRGPSEKMIVPTFTGGVEAGADDLGASARSYLRQVAAWRKMTRLSADQHGLVLYQNLSGKAWIDAERLDVDRLGLENGAEYFVEWIRERYLDVQITQIGRSLSDFFRKLRRRDGQTVRDYLSDFDRALARLTECGCSLPDMASAWVFVDRMGLEESAELNLLASVGNEYNLKRLQQAAIVQDRSLRKPWESSTRSSSRDSAANGGRGPRREWWNKKGPNTTHLTENGDYEENGDDDLVPEEIAEEWYETFMTHETAKQKYKNSLRQRGTDSEALRELANDRLAQAKAKSFCAGCKRRGHWHKDSCCPLNQGAKRNGDSNHGGDKGAGGQGGNGSQAKTNYQCSVVYVTWDMGKPTDASYLMAITDTACSKSVMGASWLESYLTEAAKVNHKPQFVNINENFKFGASRIFEAGYAVIVTFALKQVVVQAKVAVVQGDVPLLLSRGVLAKLGTVLDVAENTADFKYINVRGFPLKITDTGHPAVPFVPIRPPVSGEARKDWAQEDLVILNSESAYTGVTQPHPELVNEALRVGITIHPKWTVPEIRSVIMEHRAEVAVTSADAPPKPLSGMRLDELKETAMLHGVELPMKVTRGQAMRLIRDATEDMSTKVMAFGRYRGWTFAETPEQYQQWAVAEVERSANASEDLKMFANWVRNKGVAGRSSFTYDPSLDPEFNATVPYEPSEVDSTSWGMVSRAGYRAERGTSSANLVLPTAKARAPPPAQGAIPRLPPRQRQLEETDSISSMDHEAGNEALDEIKKLEARLAVLKDRTTRARKMERSVTINSILHYTIRNYLFEDQKISSILYTILSYLFENQMISSILYTILSYLSLVHKYHRATLTTWHPFTPRTKEGLSKAMSLFGFRTVMIDLPEWDLVRVDRRRDLLRLVANLNPDVLWCAPPQKDELCHGGTKEIQEAYHDVIKRLYQQQFQRNLVGVIELPRSSPTWKADGFDALDGFPVFLEECAYGSYVLDSHGEAMRAKRETKLQVTREEIGTMLSRRCPGDHVHAPGHLLRNSRGTPKGRRLYREKFCYDVAQVLAESIGNLLEDSIPDYENHPNRKATKDKTKDESNGVAEAIAKEALTKKDFSYRALLQITTRLNLPGIANNRTANTGGTGTPTGIICGLWVHGGVHGITRSCENFPYVVKYINKFARHHGVQGWTSFSLARNLQTTIHRDPNNLSGYDSVTTTFGDFTGGELWQVCDPDDASEDVVWHDGMAGLTVNTKERLVAFDSRELHATRPWKGDRWCLTWYISRAVLKTTLEERDALRALGFPINSLANRKKPKFDDHGRGEFIRWPEKRRPRKSTRTQLWKMAKRLSTFATWSILATTTLLGLTEPAAGHNSVLEVANTEVENVPALFEIGGMDQTLQATALGIDTIEPMVKLDLRQPRDLHQVKDLLQELRPRNLWVNGDELHDTTGLSEVFKLQESLGGRVTLDGKLGGPLWSSDFGNTIYQRAGTLVKYKKGRLQVHLGKDTAPAEEEELSTSMDPDKAKNLLEKYLLKQASKDPEGDYEVKENFPVEAQNRAGAQPEEPSSRGASAINFKGAQPKPEVASALRRLHQNLGHPAVADLTRHLRLAGAGPEVIAAAKNMTCEVCRRAQGAKSPKPAALPTTTSFNEIIGVDAFTVYDCNGEKLEMFSIYDYGTSYHLVGELPGHSTEAMEQALCDLWTRVFGPPKTILVDLESGLQAGLERFASWFGSRIRSAAGQAPWQVGAVERHGGVWKHMWRKVVDEHSITKDAPGDVKLGITAINAAKNELRRLGGYSPTQAVYGRDPDVPGELLDHRDPQQVDEILTRDQLRAREHTLRQAARIAYHRAQVDSKLRRALLQRSRVAGEDLNPGDIVYFFRKPKNKKDWRWVGPATVVGHEKKNLWVASSGRCHLVAPEHIRKATGEELGDLFTLRTTQDDLHRLLDEEPSDPQVFEYPAELPDDVDVDFYLPSGDENGLDLPEDEVMPMEGERRRGLPGEGPRAVSKRYRVKGPEEGHEVKTVRFGFDEDTYRVGDHGHETPTTMPAGILKKAHSVPDDFDFEETYSDHENAQVDEVYMVKRAITERGKQKQLEKELPWSCIPDDKKDTFRAAERQQWQEHLDHDAVEPVSVEESRRILREKPERVLPSRYAYRDKNWSKRKKDPALDWKPKARLVIGGHLDPDLHLGLQTSGLKRELYIRQPRSGLGDLHPEQLVKLTKGVFGLVDSPAAWWGEFKGTLGQEEFTVDGVRTKFFHCPLDPCIFQLRRIDEQGNAFGEPLSYLAVHVDDVLLIGPRQLCKDLRKRISELFPVQEWDEGAFDYIGSYIEVTDGEVHVTQTGYTNTRLFEIPIRRGQQGDDPATMEQKADNRSLVGALSWLAGQTRPDLQTGVSMAQQLQRDPTVDDIKFSNQLAKRAQEHDHRGVVLRPVDLERAVLLAYHDAGWANAPQDSEDPFYVLYPEDEEAGRIREGPFSQKDRRAKRSNSRIASQLGGLYLLTDKDILQGQRRKVSLLDWRSAACDRVCRSTFAAESMGCCGAIENADFIRKFLSTLLTGELTRKEDGRFEVRYLSDCRSLYDHLAREGIPRIPSERRLAIDMAAIRQDLAICGKICWVPTDQQFADMMTKPQRAGDWWETLMGALRLPFVEKL